MRCSIFVFLCALSFSGQAQKLAIDNSSITFFSDAPLENITAVNLKTTGLFNLSTGDIAFSVPIKEFRFEKALMQQHFNEKYMETDKYPKATFQGVITCFDTKVSGLQNVRATGKLTIHGIMKAVELPGVMERNEDTWIVKTTFMVNLADYNIKIPQLLFQKIAEQVEVTADFTFTLK